jgi:uncharacterized protein
VILYLGSSSLIKLYINEPYSDIITAWVKVSEIVTTCRVAYTEVMSALDMRLRKGDLLKKNYEKVLERFNEDWQNFAKVDFDDFEAGNLIRKYGLTRFGALHLSAAKLILNEYKQLSNSEAIKEDHSGIILFFSSMDEDLCKAATIEGLKVLSPF